MNENSKDEHELEKIRLKKMKQLMEAQKQQQETKEKIMSFSEKINFLLRTVLNSDAYSYLESIRTKEPNVYRAIYNELVSPEVIQEIDYLLAIINRQGGVPRRIPLDVIIYLERKVKGIRSSVKVKRGNGEMMDLGSYLTK